MKKETVKKAEKCSRCGAYMAGPSDGWLNCPKCHLSRFVGDNNAPANAEKTEEPVPSPTEKVEEVEEVEPKK